MNVKTLTVRGPFRMPMTQHFSLLDGRLNIFVRSWNGMELCQKIADEVSHFLVATEADVEVTNPFEYFESLSQLANHLKISVQLANDKVHNTENRETYENGAEVFILYSNQFETAWLSVGRFSFEIYKEGSNIKIHNCEGFIDDQVLLPPSLLGISKNLDFSAGSFSNKSLQSIKIESNYLNQQTAWQASISY